METQEGTSPFFALLMRGNTDQLVDDGCGNAEGTPLIATFGKLPLTDTGLNRLLSTAEFGVPMDGRFASLKWSKEDAAAYYRLSLQDVGTKSEKEKHRKKFTRVRDHTSTPFLRCYDSTTVPALPRRPRLG